MATDRPDYTEASSTVGRGRFQLESGYTFLNDRNGGSRMLLHSYPETLLRVGLFADWFEFRVAQTFFSSHTQGEPSRVGASDLYLGSKLALTEQAGLFPETAVILQGTVPTGAEAFTFSRVLYGINYLFGWDVIPDAITLGGSFQANNAGDAGRSYTLLSQSLTMGYKLSKNLNSYTEWYALYPSRATYAESGAKHFFNGGFQYFVTDNLAFDIRAGLQLNRHVDVFFGGIGMAMRY
jgi:hypothetical protein